MTAVADKVAQYLENELMINRRCFVRTGIMPYREQRPGKEGNRNVIFR